MSAHRWVPGIDMVKPVLALLVIWIHTQPLAGITPRVSAYATIGVARLAVPLYLAISGYLLFRRADAPVRRQLRRVLELYAVWLVIYLPVIIRDELEEGLQGPLHLVQLLLTGGRTHLWYLPAAAVGIVIVAAGLKVLSPGRLIWSTCPWLPAMVSSRALLCLLVAVTTAKPLPGQLLARNTGSLVYFIHYWVMLALGADLVHSAGLVRGVLITLVSFALGAALVQASQLRGLGVLKRLY